MARYKNTYPQPFLRQRRSSWQIRWQYENDEYVMSIGKMTREEAKTTCAAVAVALAERDEWPTDLVAAPAVKRYLAVKAGNDVHDDDKKLIEQYAEHLRINSRSSWNLSVKSHLTAASYFTSNLLLAKTPMLTDFLNAIHD
ncbi:MAG: hypothetical protein LIQ31_05465, partial [Planctomycetes bacterium]|nr:hypothetical protein [Planctomycetota bacterium]